MTADTSYCMPHDILNYDQIKQMPHKNSEMLATSTSIRVDIWRLQQKKQKAEEEKGDDSNSDDYDFDQQTPLHTLSRFDDAVTAIKLREDGQVILAGDKLGTIQLYELNQKIKLREYKNQFKNQINFLDFSSERRNFVACSNETSWKYFDI